MLGLNRQIGAGPQHSALNIDDLRNGLSVVLVSLPLSGLQALGGAPGLIIPKVPASGSDGAHSSMQLLSSQSISVSSLCSCDNVH